MRLANKIKQLPIAPYWATHVLVNDEEDLFWSQYPVQGRSFRVLCVVDTGGMGIDAAVDHGWSVEDIAAIICKRVAYQLPSIGDEVRVEGDSWGRYVPCVNFSRLHTVEEIDFTDSRYPICIRTSAGQTAWGREYKGQAISGPHELVSKEDAVKERNIELFLEVEEEARLERNIDRVILRINNGTHKPEVQDMLLKHLSNLLAIVSASSTV